MIKTGELRIGNYYQSVKFNTTVICDLSDFYDLCAHADGAFSHPPIDKMFKPILLTEEWLINFGFHEKYKSTSNRWYKHSGLINQGLELHDCEDENGDIHGVFLYEFCLEIKYVHQLQNLYFAKTGEELTIKK